MVVVLHGDHRPPSGPMARIAEPAELRFTDAGGLGEALPGAEILFAAKLEAWTAGEPLRNVVDTSLGYVPSAHT